MEIDFFITDNKIYDSVHGFIRFDDDEKELIDSIPFQRLHDNHQLGVTYLVYPGATHSRFEHSLGVMFLSSIIFDTVCKYARPDAFHFVPRKGSGDYLYWRKILRLAALCHDIGHLPFSHVAEKELLGESGHEDIAISLIKSEQMRPIWDKVCKNPHLVPFSSKRDLVEDICKISVGENRLKVPFSPWEKIVASIITGDFFGADRIDYLLRDSKATGVVHGNFDYEQLIEMMRILPGSDKDYELGIDANGMESCEALMLSRYFMHKRVYQNASVKACNFHLKNFMQKNYPKEIFKNLNTFLDLDDSTVMHKIKKATKDLSHPANLDAQRLINREKRFRAISIPSDVDIDKLKQELKMLGIDKENIGFEINNSFMPDAGLNFPVAKHHLSIKKAKEVSLLLANVPSSLSNWLFVPHEFEIPVLDLIERIIEQ